MKIQFILLVVSTFVSCATENKVEQNNSENVVEEKKENPTSSFVECDLRDTTIKGKNWEYNFKKVDEFEYEISWGNDDLKKIYPEKFWCSFKEIIGVCDFTPKFEIATENHLVLKVATSTPSAGNCSPIEYKIICLPLSEKEDPFEVKYFLKAEKKYVVYSNSIDSIFVMNLNTKRNQSIPLIPKPYFIFKTIDYSMDSIQIIGKELYFEYLTGTHEENDYHKKMIRLRI
ncbi:MAG: hypothetical protein AB8F94_16795 [Saprospiraceae bacterium]